MTMKAKLLAYTALALIAMLTGYNVRDTMRWAHKQVQLRQGVAPVDGHWYLKQPDGSLRQLTVKEVDELGLEQGVSGTVFSLDREAAKGRLGARASR